MKSNTFTPDFLIPGFGKSGTSSLHQYLDQHPNILMSSPKEPHNYSVLSKYKKRYDNDTIHSFPNIFENKGLTTKLLGESSTSYLLSRYTPELIYKDNPEMRFVIIARDPIDRIRSHYNWHLSLGNVKKKFRSEIEDWVREEFDINDRRYLYYKYYIDGSLYGKHLERYLQYFNIENFHFLSTENLKKQPEVEVKKCFSFLGLSDNVDIESIFSNKTKQRKRKRVNIPEKYSFIKPMIPKMFKGKIKNILSNWQVMKDRNMEINKLSEEDVAWLKSILIDDINLFKQLTNNSFPEWKYFN